MFNISEVYHILKRSTTDKNTRQLYREQNVLLGENVIIGETCNIGEYTYIGDYTTARQDVRIGRYSSIGEYCIIGPGEHRTEYVSTCYWLYKESIAPENYYNGDNNKFLGGVSIGNDVWIGCRTIIRRGVHIGDGAIIGANSFVTQDVPNFAIWAGSPARPIRYRFGEDLQKAIISTAWWDYDIDMARQIVFDIEKKYGISYPTK